MRTPWRSFHLETRLRFYEALTISRITASGTPEALSCFRVSGSVLHRHGTGTSLSGGAKRRVPPRRGSAAPKKENSRREHPLQLIAL